MILLIEIFNLPREIYFLIFNVLCLFFIDEENENLRRLSGFEFKSMNYF